MEAPNLLSLVCPLEKFLKISCLISFFSVANHSQALVLENRLCRYIDGWNVPLTDPPFAQVWPHFTAALSWGNQTKAQSLVHGHSSQFPFIFNRFYQHTNFVGVVKITCLRPFCYFS